MILTTDGEETSEGDPVAAISTLRGRGADLRINIVGYAIDDAKLAKTSPVGLSLGRGVFFRQESERTCRGADRGNAA